MKTKYKAINRRYIIISIFLYATMFVDIIRIILSLIGLNSSYNEIIRNVIYISIFFFYYRYSNKIEKSKSLIISVIFLFVILFSCLLNSFLAESSFGIIMLFFSRFLIAAVMFNGINDIEVFTDFCHSMSWIAILYYILYSLSYYNQPQIETIGFNYNMAFANNMILPAVSSMYFILFKQRRVIYSTVVLFFSLIGIIQFGSRGALACIISSFFVSVVLIFIEKKNGYFYILLTVFLICLFYLFQDSILQWMLENFPNSRTLLLLKNNSFNTLSNRDITWEVIINGIIASPLKIRGLAGDCSLMCEHFSNEFSLASYSHNFFLEMLASFGVIIGGIICIWFFYMFGKLIIHSIKYRNINAITVVFFVPNVTLMMFSGSICQSYQHWIVLGILFLKSYNNVASSNDYI